MTNLTEKKLNIAIVTNNYKPYSGGIVSSIDSFVTELHKKGHKAFIITLDFLDNGHNDPYHVIRIPSLFRFDYKKNPMAIPIRKTKKIEEIIKLLNPDIIHLQHPFFICKSALKIAKKLNIPTVFTYHTIYEKYLHYIPIPKFISKLIVKKTVLSFCKKVDQIIVPSNYIENYLLKNNIKTKIAKIPSGILPIFIKKDIHKEKSKEFKLLTLGRFVKEKNIPFLLNTFKKLSTEHPDKNFKFTLAGYGNEYENIRKYAYKKLKLKSNVKFINHPRKQDIADLYCQSDIFLFSSKSDTQGIVLAEAMGCGCPIISLDGPGQRDIIKNQINGFLCKSENEMVEKILSLEKNKELHKTLQKGALEKAKQYHPTITSNKLIAVYKKIWNLNN